MSDIVTRLRECWCHPGWRDRGLVDPACDHDGVRAEAADEIERLREELRQRHEYTLSVNVIEGKKWNPEQIAEVIAERGWIL